MKSIIAVDDDPGILDSLQIILSRAGYSVNGYPDPSLLYSGNFEVPDIFVLDKQLSGADGLDVCRFLKAQKTTENVPVIMISANMNIGGMAREAGADAFLEKPFRIKELVALVKQYAQ